MGVAQIAVQLEYSDDYVDVSWEDPRVDIFVKDVVADGSSSPHDKAI